MSGRNSREKETPIPERNRTFWGALYEKMRDRLVRSNHYRIDPSEAEGIVQDTFLKLTGRIRGRKYHALQRSVRREGTAPAERLAHTVNTNTRTDRLRTGKKRSGNISLDAFADQESAPGSFRERPMRSSSDISLPVEMTEHRESMRAVSAALAQLTEDQRQVVTMSFLDGYTTEEIAGILGKENGAVRALKMRGLQRLKELLKAFK